MQAAKIKVGEVYAFKRGPDWVRFHVEAKIGRDQGDGTKTTLEGYFVEDGFPHAKTPITLTPDALDGPYQEKIELVERKAKEDAERKAKEDARKAQGDRDRLLLYRFVGIQAPRDKATYSQHFRNAYGSVEINRDGIRALIEKIEAIETARDLTAEQRKLTVVSDQS